MHNGGLTGVTQKGAGKTVRIFVVDDHPIVRHGLSQLIAQERDLKVCGGAAAVPEALVEIPRLKPDLVLVDVSLQSGSGIELVKTLRGLMPRLPIIMLSMHDEMLCAERALRAGANGYIMKSEPPETVLKAVRAVLRGEIYVGERMAHRMLSGLLGAGKGEKRKPGGIGSLTDRQLEIFDMIGRGIGTRDIADRLQLSVKTVETHRSYIKQKLGLSKGSELLQVALSWVSGIGDGPH